jgi:hypothetical protein
MEMLRDYFNSMSTEGDTRVSTQEAEQMDVEIVEAIQNHLIPVVAKGGAGHVTRILSGLLSQGSSRVSDDPLKVRKQDDQKMDSRENFSRACFDALLQLTVEGMGECDNSTSVEALNHWITHCEDSVVKFTKEAGRYQSVPLPHSRVTEMVLSLRSLTSLIDALHSRQGTVPREVWQRIRKLYPLLVTCVSCDSKEIRVCLQKTLSCYSSLLTDTYKR